MILFTAAMARAAREVRSAVTLRLLLILPSYLGFMDFRRLPTAAAAEARTDASGVSRSMAELLKLGIVEREGKGPYTMWRLSSDWGWNGTPDQWHAMRAGRLRGKQPPAARAAGAAPAAPAGAEPGAAAPRQARLRLLREVPGG